jgi:hypothetical protein
VQVHLFDLVQRQSKLPLAVAIRPKTTSSTRYRDAFRFVAERNRFLMQGKGARMGELAHWVLRG